MVLSAQRRPLSVEPLTAIPFQPTATRMRYDSGTRTFVKYAVEGRIETLRATGDFLVSWNGSDGARHQLTWVPPNKLSVIVAARVSFDELGGLYTYSYAVSNLISSHQALAMLFIEGRGLEGAEEPNGSWYSSPLTPFLREELSISDGWIWSQPSGPRGIPPGQIVSGFRLASSVPPGVVRCYAVGRTPDLSSTGEEMPEELHEAIDEAYYRLPEGFTIGPAPVEAENPEEELSQLVSFLDEAELEGWLGSPELAASILSSLEGIRSALSRGNTVQATEGITTVIGELDRLEDEGVLSEGKALLEYRLSSVRAHLGSGDSVWTAGLPRAGHSSIFALRGRRRSQPEG